MIITVVNMSNMPDMELHPTIRAINRQIKEDFEPYWSLGATLRLEGKTGASQPDDIQLPEMRGDAVLYLWDQADVDNALGYHARNGKGLPFGFVFTEVAAQVGESVSVTLSHEALELIADPLANLLVAGPHPEEDRTVFHWFEMSDAVQAESYVIDGVEVSNFLLPLYFTPDAEAGARNDFLGNSHDGKTLPSFGVNPGGYIGFYDPLLQQDVTYSTFARSEEAKARMEAKRMNVGGRRSCRMADSRRQPARDNAVLMARCMAVPPARKSGVSYQRIE